MTPPHPSSRTALACTLLDWDSELLGVQVARIDARRGTSAELRATLQVLADAGTRLVYWLTDGECARTQEAASENHGYLSDLRTTFAMNLPPHTIEDASLTSDPAIQLAPVPPGEMSDDLERLAWISGEQSRFAVDPRIPRDRYEALYSEWIRNSVNRSIAREVLVLRSTTGELCGMITLGEKNGRGDIGLIAITPQRQGQSLGTRLVRAAQRWARGEGYLTAQVVTQGANLGAGRLYARTGYEGERVEPFWHLWLDS